MSRTTRIVQDIELTPAQSIVDRCEKRFISLICGRRWGKTWYSLRKLYRKALTLQAGNQAWYVAPTYRQAKDIAWRELKLLVPKQLIKYKSETDLSLELYNGVLVQLRGAEDPDKLRGPSLQFLVADEFSVWRHPWAWTKVLRPMMSDRRKPGSGIFIGTPQGFNHAYELHEYAKQRDSWAAFHFTTVDGGNVSEDEIEDAKHDLDERSFRQEYLASFESLVGRVYYSYDSKLDQVAFLPPIANLEMHWGMDFNVDPMTAVGAQAVGEQCHVFDEIVIKNSNTEEVGREILRRYPNHRHIIYPDPTGRGRSTKGIVGDTDHKILQRLGFQVYVPYGVYAVSDRINTVNGMFKNMVGDRRVVISAKCSHLSVALDGFCYKEGTSIPDPKSPHIHITDAFGYLIMGRWPMSKRTATSREFDL